MLHAKLSASSAHRWLYCPMIVSLEADSPRKDTEYTREGTAAHELVEIKLQYQTGKIKKAAYNKKYKAFTENSAYFNASMNQYTDEFVDYVMERYNSYEDAYIELECRVDYGRWVPGGFGTSDVLILTEDVLEVIDFKYGTGKFVSAENNDQMGLYALGAYNVFGMLYDFQKVRMTIVQPRIGNLSSVEIWTEELLYWANHYVAQRAAQADVGIGSWDIRKEVLQWSPIAGALVPYAAKCFEVIDPELRAPDLLEPEDIAEILDQADLIESWLKAVKAYAFNEAYNGNEIPGYKLVEGRSNRVITDAEAAAERLEEAGFNDVWKPKELLSMTELEKRVGKKQFGEILRGLIIKPTGKPVLVPESDKRPEYRDTTNDFE